MNFISHNILAFPIEPPLDGRKIQLLSKSIPDINFSPPLFFYRIDVPFLSAIRVYFG